MADTPAATEASPTQTDVQKWTAELEASKQFLEKFHERGTKVVNRFTDERTDLSTTTPTSRLNLFHANIVTMLALMYDKLPKVEADRRFADPNDDVARVAGEIISRVLTNDMNAVDNDLKTVLKHALWDRLVPGLGVARVKYAMEEDEKSEPVGTVEGEVGEDPTSLYPKKDEWCEEIYVHWQDYRYSPCRTRLEMTWDATRSYMTREEVVKRFGPGSDNGLSFTSKGPKTLFDGTSKAPPTTAGQAEVWEIWDKPTKMVYWWSQGAADLLDSRPDPLKLAEFFPTADPMAANLTTSKYVPKADFVIAQDIYNKIDQIETRLSLLVDACKAVGVYAGDSEAVKNMLQEGVENQLIPVDNWAMYLERGGMKGAIDWFPIEQVANVIQVLSTEQQSWIQKLYQVTGMSDILRGQASSTGVTATEQKIKAQFGSVRITALQNEFALFATDLLNKKVQIIRNFYDADRIKKLSNIDQTPDAALADQAIALIKDPTNFDLRVAIRSDSMSAVDMDALKQERTQFLQAVSQFVGQATQVATTMPDIIPFLMQLMKFGLAGFKSSSEMEGIIDQAIGKMEQTLAAKAAAPPQPSPEQQKMQADMQMAQQQFQLDSQTAQQSAALEQQKAQSDLQMKREEFELDKQKMQMELEYKQQELAMKQQELQMKIQADQQAAQVDMHIKARQAEQDDARAERGFVADQARADTAAEADAKRAEAAETGE